jgi:hypothetical protein
MCKNIYLICYSGYIVLNIRKSNPNKLFRIKTNYGLCSEDLKISRKIDI